MFDLHTLFWLFFSHFVPFPQTISIKKEALAFVPVQAVPSSSIPNGVPSANR